ncbi:MAG: DUF1028 domain-containing protein [Actinomycetota bacterium]
MTFSIVACDLSCDPPEWGVAVASKFLAVGAVVPCVSAGVGAIATQAYANTTYGPEGLKMLEIGADAAAVTTDLTAADEQRDQRQLGVVDGYGRPSTFTGAECPDWAGGRTGDGYCCQGNILVGPEVVDAMSAAFEATSGDLAVRLLAALTAGDDAGGDRRGRQSAAVIVAGKEAGYLGGSDVRVDLRVDDHESPVTELARLLEVHRFYFPRKSDLDFITIDDPLSLELRALLRSAGYDAGEGTVYDQALSRALMDYMGTENLEERWSDRAEIERGVLDYLRATPSLDR